MSFNWKYVKLNNLIQVNHGNARQNKIGGSYIKRITENNIGGSYNTRITENNNETLDIGKEIQNDGGQISEKFKCPHSK